MKAIKVIERSTGVEYVAKAIEGGYEIYTIEDKGENPELYKKVKESTFKRYFRIVKSQDVSGHDEAPKTGKSTSKAKSDDTGHVEKVSAEKREHMVEKIKKMLALAEDNPSMEEGLSAALQAQKLMAKYSISEDEVTLKEINEEITSLFTQQKHNSHLHNWRKPLATIVARNFRCKCYLRGEDVVFRGYRRDAEIALNVYLTLYKIGNSLGSKAYWEQKNETGSGKGIYNSFVIGFLKGVESGLTTQCTALMVIVPKEVEDDWTEFSAGFKTSTLNGLRVSDVDAYENGYREGEYAVKSRSIEKKGGK